MNPFAWNFRAQFGLGAALCAAMLGYALYVEHGLFMMPCPLCILQRVAFAGMGFFFLLGAAIGPRPTWWRKSVTSLVVLCAAGGAGIAIWHLYIQNLPPSAVPSCTGMDLSYMLDAFPLQKVLEKIFTPSGDCAVVDWTFLGLAMPAWTLVWYVILGVAALWAGFRKRP
jgi:disulfide bond formation protein DsbB